MQKSIIALVFCFAGIFVNAHPIKIATGKLEFDLAKQECQIIINFFIDDFESAIRALYPQPAFDFIKPSEIMESTFTDYISKNLSIGCEEKTINLSIKRILKIEENVCQVILTGSFSDLPKSKTIYIINTLLIETYNKQSNILHVFINGEQKTILQFYPGSAKKEVDLN